MPETADQEAALSKEATMQRLAIEREELIIFGLFSCHFRIQILSLFLITSLRALVLPRTGNMITFVSICSYLPSTL
jgi:hypothetical protein